MKKDHFYIESDRLYIRPLTKDQLLNHHDQAGILADQLGIYDARFDIEEEFSKGYSDAIESFCKPNLLAHPDDYMWYTFWYIISKEKNVLIGSIGCAGKPKDGVVEIGYCINIPFRKLGYASEAVIVLSKWLFEQEEVHTVMAHTLQGDAGLASQKVLIKAGFTNHGSEITDDGDVYIWKKNKN